MGWVRRQVTNGWKNAAIGSLKTVLTANRSAQLIQLFPDKNTRTLCGAMIGVNCAQACEEFP
jgi:hypothetical protein